MSERALTRQSGVDALRQPVVFVRGEEVFSSSNDVAEFFEKRHDDVLKAIDNLIVQEASLRLRSFAESSYTNDLANGRSYRAFDMNRDGFTLLAMGFTGSKALRWKLKYIEAFNLMEAELRSRQTRDPMDVLNDPAAMRGLLLSYSEKVLTLQGQVSTLAPKAGALDRIATSDGSLCITDAAKTLQIPPRDLFRHLRANGWIYARAGTSDIGYQVRINQGTLEHKVTTIARQDGTEKTITQVRVTPKGLSVLAEAFEAKAA